MTSTPATTTSPTHPKSPSAPLCCLFIYLPAACVITQAPDVLVNDLALHHLVELRPSTGEQLALISGFGEAAMRHFAAPLLRVLTDFCAHAAHLRHDTDWSAVAAARSAALHRPAAAAAATTTIAAAAAATTTTTISSTTTTTALVLLPLLHLLRKV